MYVEAHTSLSAMEVLARLEALAGDGHGGAGGRRPLVYQVDARSARLYLKARRFAPGAAAEVAVDGYHQGAAIVLRPMWGPLAALLPRLLALSGLLLAGLMLVLSERGALLWMLAAAAITLPLAVLVYQHVGERRLRARLGEVLGGLGFTSTKY